MQKERPIYNRLKICLAIKHIPNKELAKHLEVTEQTVSKWCTNTTHPSIPQLFAIADFLKIPVADILEKNHTH